MVYGKTYEEALSKFYSLHIENFSKNENLNLTMMVEDKQKRVVPFWLISQEKTINRNQGVLIHAQNHNLQYSNQRQISPKSKEHYFGADHRIHYWVLLPSQNVQEGWVAVVYRGDWCCGGRKGLWGGLKHLLLKFVMNSAMKGFCRTFLCYLITFWLGRTIKFYKAFD